MPFQSILEVDLEIHHSISESFYVGSASFRHWFQKINWLWYELLLNNLGTRLKTIWALEQYRKIEILDQFGPIGNKTRSVDHLPSRSFIMFFFISFFTSFSFTWFKIFFVIVNFQVFVFCFISLKSIGFQEHLWSADYLDRLVCISRSSGLANPWSRSVWIIFPNPSRPSCHHHGRAPMSDALLLSCSKSKNHKY